MKRFYSLMLSAVVAVAASAAAPRVATEVVSPLPGGLNFTSQVEKTNIVDNFQATTLAKKMNKRGALNLVKRSDKITSLKRKTHSRAEGEEGSKYDGVYTMTIADYYFETSTGQYEEFDVMLYVEDGEAEIYDMSEEWFITPVPATFNEETGVMTFNNFCFGAYGDYYISFMPMSWDEDAKDNIYGDVFSITYDEETESFIFPADGIDYGFAWPAWETEEGAEAFDMESSAGLFFQFDVFEMNKKAEGGEDPGEDEETWTSLGMGEWYEGLMSIYDVIESGAHWSVEIEECDQTPGLYRMKPYSYENNVVAQILNSVDNNTVVIVNATNPDKVYTVGDIEPYDMITFSGGNPENGFTSLSYYGTLKDGVISFPAKSFLYYEPEDGKWYYTNDENFKIALPGAVVKDYALKATSEHACSDQATTTVDLNVGEDISKLYMMVYKGNADASAGDNSQKVVSSGSEIPVADSVTFDTPDQSGHYSILFAGVNSSDEIVASATSYMIVDAENDADWRIVPETTTVYEEGILAVLFKDINEENFDVELEENVNTPGRFRFEAPYANHSHASVFTLADHSHKHYIYVNATDPDAVFVEPSALGVSYGKYGGFYTLTADNKGTYANDVIDVPSFISMSNESATYSGGSVKLTMTRTQSGIKEISSSAADKAIFDIQGRRVAAPARGLYIINGKKAFVK